MMVYHTENVRFDGFQHISKVLARVLGQIPYRHQRKKKKSQDFVIEGLEMYFHPEKYERAEK